MTVRRPARSPLALPPRFHAGSGGVCAMAHGAVPGTPPVVASAMVRSPGRGADLLCSLTARTTQGRGNSCRTGSCGSVNLTVGVCKLSRSFGSTARLWRENCARRLQKNSGVALGGPVRLPLPGLRQALEAPLRGAEHCIIAAADTVMARPSRELMAECFPSVPITPSLGEFETLQSNAKAQRLLGYVPRYSWRETA